MQVNFVQFRGIIARINVMFYSSSFKHNNYLRNIFCDSRIMKNLPFILLSVLFKTRFKIQNL